MGMRPVNAALTDDFPGGDRSNLKNIKSRRLALAVPPSFERGSDVANLLVLINLDLVYRKGGVRQGPSFESFQHRVGRLDRCSQVTGGTSTGFAAFHFLNSDDDEASLNVLAKQFGIKLIADTAQRDRAAARGFDCYQLDAHFSSVGRKIDGVHAAGDLVPMVRS